MNGFKAVLINDSMLQLGLDSLQLTIQSGKFKNAHKKIPYEKPDGQAHVKQIDGRVPPRQYRLIRMAPGPSSSALGQNDYNDLFEPDPDLSSAHMDKSAGIIYITAMNSDRAGSFMVVWLKKSIS